MAPKGKYLNITQQKLVKDLVKQGNTYRKVEELTNIPFTTEGAIVNKYKQYETFEKHWTRMKAEDNLTR